MRRLARAALLAYLVIPGALTLTGSPPTGWLLDFYAGLREAVDVLTIGRAQVSLREAEALANVLMFVPVGVLLRLSYPQQALSVLLVLSAIGSLGIEVVQFLLLPGRVPSLVDVLNNTGGAAIGLTLGADARSLLRRRAGRRQRRRGNSSAAARYIGAGREGGVRGSDTPGREEQT